MPLREKSNRSPLTVRVIGSPVSVNAMYGRRVNGKTYLRPAALAWEHSVWGYTLASDPPCSCHNLTPPLRVDVTFFNVRGDADNYLKATLDGLKHALRVDDKYFTQISAHVVRKSNEPRGCLIVVTPAQENLI